LIGILLSDQLNFKPSTSLSQLNSIRKNQDPTTLPETSSLDTEAAVVVAEVEMEREREMMRIEKSKMKLNLINSSSEPMRTTRSSQAKTMQEVVPISTANARCATSGISKDIVSLIARTKKVTYLTLIIPRNRSLLLEAG
jgi:hypothetical protein